MDGKSTEVGVGAHRISVTVFGSGEPAVVIEPAFGGSAQSWHAIAGNLGEQTTVVTYDRAPYGTSSRAADHRTPAEIAAIYVIASQSGHYIHKSESGLVTTSIRDVPHSANGNPAGRNGAARNPLISDDTPNGLTWQFAGTIDAAGGFSDVTGIETFQAHMPPKSPSSCR